MPSASWPQFGGNPQHTEISAVAAQRLDSIHWQTSIDLQPGGSEHYGEPVFTPANTVIVPVKTGQTGTFEVQGVNGASGSVLWTLTTDYQEPPYSWLPPFQPVYDPVSDRAYFPGNGGTVYYVTHPDAPGASISGQFAFYGLANYLANPTAYNGSVMIDTPLTLDSSGNVYCGFMVTGSNPPNLTGGGVARFGANGTDTFILAATASGDNAITRAALGSAPALSNDGATVYIAVNNTDQYHAYLLGLDSTSLATKYKAFLLDPRNGNGAGVIDQSTASPMVGPDGKVFFGVFGNPYNGSRGFLLQFPADLSQSFTPGAFGWDDTPSVIPTTMIPSYHGTSPYFILSKYNNYVAAETGNSGGDGVNKIAILDPFAGQNDPNNDSDPSLQVMAQVQTITSPTPDIQYTNNGYPNAVREWCTNGTAVDPASDSVFINNEDGNAYRWNLGSNTLTQSIQLTNGIGEPYTPTAIGPDGTIYALNGGTLFALGNLPTSAVYRSTDSTAQGNWQGTYGTEGYQVIGGSANIPTYATVTPSGNTTYVWAGSTADARALQNPPSTTRVAAAWYKATSFNVDVNLTDGLVHALSFYVLDWDNKKRTERIDVLNAATGTVLDSRTASSFSTGEYLSWNIRGHVVFRITDLSGPNAVLSGLFFGKGAPVAPTATFVKTDATTKGSWQGVYGANGHDVVGGAASIPGYATLAPSGNSTYVWSSSTSDPRALQNPGGNSVAATWYNAAGFSVGMNLNDGQAHQISMYLLDWDKKGRSERIDVIDPTTGAVLDSQTVSSFSGGVYLVWNVTGNVQFRITNLHGPNAVLSGIFFG